MKAKFDYMNIAPDVTQALMTPSLYVERSGLEKSLLNLVKLRASQINGCAFCIDMHVREAQAAGESGLRLHLLPAWRETDIYTPRERAALAWTEALTQIDHAKADVVFDEVRKHFSDEEMPKLALAIGVINIWNRFNIAFGVTVAAEKAAA